LEVLKQGTGLKVSTYNLWHHLTNHGTVQKGRF